MDTEAEKKVWMEPKVRGEILKCLQSHTKKLEFFANKGMGL